MSVLQPVWRSLHASLRQLPASCAFIRHKSAKGKDAGEGVQALAKTNKDTKGALAVGGIDKTELEASTITEYGQAYLGDLRSTSGLGLGDGLLSHTSKWYEGTGKTPMEYIQEAPPIKVHGLVAASTGTDDPALGCPVEYLDLRGTSKERPAVCKYTGNKFYSDDWKHPGRAHH